jgi:hypothetical protein
MIKIDYIEIGEGRNVEWIHLTHDRDHWRDLVNAVMKHMFLAP